jgi:hypothetical protein
MMKERDEADAAFREFIAASEAEAAKPEKLTPDEAKLRYWVSMGLTNAARELRRRMGK